MKLVFTLLLGFASLSSQGFSQENKSDMAIDAVSISMALGLTENLIDWKVGDSSEYKITIPSFPLPMGLNKKVTEDTGDSIWVVTKVTGIQPQTVEMLIRKADGKVTKMIKNGKEEPVPSDEGIQIISSDPDTVTVPAGTFKTVKITAKTSEGYDLIVWMNPNEIPMDGSAKQDITADGTNMIVELTKFLKQ